MSYFQIFLHIGDVVIGDLQGCMQLGVNLELPPHPTHVAFFRYKKIQRA
jgi:hypothetical protein